MKLINLIKNIFTTKNEAKCRYCNSSFSYKEKKSNYLLIACDDCIKQMDNDPMKFLTYINDYTF